jgi:hypothetical protein
MLLRDGEVETQPPLSSTSKFASTTSTDGAATTAKHQKNHDRGNGSLLPVASASDIYGRRNSALHA